MKNAYGNTPSFNDEGEILCPECGTNYQHISGEDHKDGKDAGEASTPHKFFRGDLTAVFFEGECGHNWALCFGFHKGNTIVYVEQAFKAPGFAIPQRTEERGA